MKLAERGILHTFLLNTPVCLMFRYSTRPRSRFAGLYSRLISRQLTLAWKRVTVATRRPERASKIPDGFVLVGNQWEQRQQKRRSVLFV